MPSSIHKDEFGPPDQRLKGRALFFSFLFFVLILAFVIFYFSEIKKDINLLERVNLYWLILAIIFQAFTYFFAANVYRSLLSKSSLQLKLADLLKATVIALVLNQTIPSAGISGNTFMLTYLRKFNIKIAQVLEAIMMDLLTFYMAMAFVIFIFLTSSLIFFQLPHVLKAVLIGGLLIYPVLGILIIFAGSKRFFTFFKKLAEVKFIRKVFKKLYEKFGRHRIADKSLQLLPFLKQSKRITLNALIFQLMVFMADGFTIYALFHGLSMQVNLYIVLLGLVCTKIISLLPALPGALILFESSMSYFFVSLNIPLSTAIIVTMLYRLLSFWFPMPFGMLLYRRWLKEAPHD